MAGFGEALVGAFNSTYGAITTGMLRREQALTLRQEREGQERFNQDARDDELRYNLRNPDGSLNRGNIAAVPSTPTDASGAPSVGGTTLQSEPAAAAPLAPVPRARGNLQPPTAVAPPVAAPAAAPYDPAATPPRQVDSKEAPGGMAQPPAGEAARPRPPVTPEIAQEASSFVERRGNRPSEALVVSGGIAPPAVTGPGVPRAESFLPRLAQDMAEYRQEAGSSGPMTRADWDGYLTSRTLSAARNLSPQAQVQALAVTDRIRVAGLQRFLSLGIAAAEAGDMEGAARALNGANSFVPDGYQRNVTATQGGVQIVSTREAGTAGTPGASHTVTVPAAAVVRYASTMMDPQWSMTHYLAVARHEETGRHNRATEGIAAGNLAARRSEAGERAQERAGSATYIQLGTRAREAEDAAATLEATPPAAGQDPAARTAAITAARERATEARRAYLEAAPQAGERGVGIDARLEEQAAGRRQRAETSRAQREGRAPFSDGEQRRLDAARETFLDDPANQERRGRGSVPSAAALAITRRLESTFRLNRSESPAEILRILQASDAPTGDIRVDSERGVIVDRRSGRVLLRVAPEGSGSGATREPPARTEGGGSGIQTPPPASMENARPTPRTLTEREVRVRERTDARRTQESGNLERSQAQFNERAVSQYVERVRRAGISPTDTELTAQSRVLRIPVEELRRRLNPN